MIEQIEGFPPGTLGFRSHGMVSADDYRNVLVPAIESAFALQQKLRLLYHIDADFTGFEPGAMWDDAMMGFRHATGWERVALVTDVSWLRMAAAATGFLVPTHFRLFRNAELVSAIDWIREPSADGQAA